jgi:hypothetical protein
LCVQGFKQIHSTDFDETYTPTGKISTLCPVLLYTVHKELNVLQFDVQGAFSHAPLSEEVFIHTPKVLKQTSPFLKLHKAL